MRYAEIKTNDIANGEGVRVSLFLQGCHRHCKGCFNKSTWNPNGGKCFTGKEKRIIYRELERDEIAGLSILGGEPLEQSGGVTRLLQEIKEAFPEKDIWLWTGWTYENVKDSELFQYVDVVVDGEFIEELKDITLKFRGSSNQRIIRLKEVEE